MRVVTALCSHGGGVAVARMFCVHVCDCFVLFRWSFCQALVDELRIVFDKDTESFVKELWSHLILEVLLATQQQSVE